MSESRYTQSTEFFKRFLNDARELIATGRAIRQPNRGGFIAGNLPMKTEITPLLIVTKLEQYDYAGATAIAAVLLITSFILLLGINVLQRRTRKFLEPA